METKTLIMIGVVLLALAILTQEEKIVCCEITIVYPDSEPYYESIPLDECVSNIGISRIIVDDSYCIKCSSCGG